MQLCFRSQQPPKHSILLQNMGCLGRTWLGSARNLALIAIPAFVYLSDELISTFYWYPYNLKQCTAVIGGGAATQTLSFAPKYGRWDLNSGPNWYQLIAIAPHVVYSGILWVRLWFRAHPHRCTAAKATAAMEGWCLSSCSLLVLHPIHRPRTKVDLTRMPDRPRG